MSYVSTSTLMKVIYLWAIAMGQDQPELHQQLSKNDLKERITAIQDKVQQLNKEIKTVSDKLAVVQKRISLFNKKLGKVDPKMLNKRQKEAVAKLRKGIRKKSELIIDLDRAMLSRDYIDNNIEIAKLHHELGRRKEVESAFKAAEAGVKRCKELLHKQAQPALHEAERLIQEAWDILDNKKKSGEKPKSAAGTELRRRR